MKNVFILLLISGLFTPMALQARSSSDALAACAEAIKEFHPEVTGPKSIAKRRTGSRSRFEYWINAGDGEEHPMTRVYCHAGSREGVISMAVDTGNWEAGNYFVPETATTPGEARIAER